jgi:localization factor PodJL
MARSFPQAPTGDYGAAPPAGDWQALRGELVALLDQVEGQYARSAPGLPALAGFAERMRDLRFQVADGDPGDRRREALRSVSRQLERFNERGEPVPAIAHADNVLQSAIQQIRARTQPPQTAPAPPRASEYTPQPVAMPPTAPRFDDLAMAMAGLTGRLGQLETELKAQRSNGGEQMREIADQVAQLSQVVELVAGAVGETGQVKRLEGQIAGLAQLMGQTPKLDIATFTERLDVVAATVDRLADLQVQQIRHTVREAETAPDKDAIATRSLQTIEASVRNIYDRIDGLESSGVRLADLEGVTDALAQISMRLDAGADKRDSLLSLVDALNGRVNEIEYKSDAVSNLRGDIEGLRDAVLNGLEPRFG